MTVYPAQYGTTRPSRMSMARTRGALSGLLLVLLGAWGALIPFIGPSFSFAYSPDRTWQWTAARGWLEVLPGCAAFLGGLLLLLSANRATAMFGAWLAAAAGAWFVVGPTLASYFRLGSIGTPTGTSQGMRALETLAFFTGLGALILFIAACAIGRMSMRSARELEMAREPMMAQPVADEGMAGQTMQMPAAGAGPYPAASRMRHERHAQNDHSHRHFGRWHRPGRTERVDQPMTDPAQTADPGMQGRLTEQEMADREMAARDMSERGDSPRR